MINCHAFLPSGGLLLFLRGRSIAGGSNVTITDVGVGAGDALICRTDQTDCCNSGGGRTRRGEWRFPNGSLVAAASAGGDFYVTRHIQQVLLNRINNGRGQLGHYCCEVDTRDDPDASICVNMSSKLSITNLAFHFKVLVTHTLSGHQYNFTSSPHTHS